VTHTTIKLLDSVKKMVSLYLTFNGQLTFLPSKKFVGTIGLLQHFCDVLHRSSVGQSLLLHCSSIWTNLLETNEKMTHLFSLSTLKETPAFTFIQTNVHGNNNKKLNKFKTVYFKLIQ